MYSRYFKRWVDFIVACIALILLGPVFLFFSIVLYFANKGAGIFFVQERVGLGGKIFKVIKFKTMTDERDTQGKLLPDNDRLTSVGRFVRSASIDELPQLINVLKGEMALIGPRPLLVHYLPLYTKQQARRHEVRSGITGWAQVHGRNTMKFSERFKYDVWYVDHLSFKLDVRIVLLTIKSVVKGSGIVNGQNLEDVDDVGFNK